MVHGTAPLLWAGGMSSLMPSHCAHSSLPLMCLAPSPVPVGLAATYSNVNALHIQILSGSNVCISTAIYICIIDFSHCLCPSQLSLSLFGTYWPRSSPFRPEGLLHRVCLSPTHACTVVCALMIVVKMWCQSLPHLRPWKSAHDCHQWPLLSFPLSPQCLACCLSFLPQIHRTPLTRPRSLPWSRCNVH